jgi:hypothetical protein
MFSQKFFIALNFFPFVKQEFKIGKIRKLSMVQEFEGQCEF